MDPFNCIYLNIRKASRRCDAYFNHFITKFSIKPTQLHVLYYIYTFPGSRFVDLSKLLEACETTLLTEVRNLVNIGLVYKHGSDKLHPGKRYSVTDAGVKKIESILPLWKEMNSYLEKLAGMSSEQLCEIIKKVGPVVDYHSRMHKRKYELNE